MGGGNFTTQQWQYGLKTTLKQVHLPMNRVVVLGDIPVLPKSVPECLARSSSNVQSCSGSPETKLTKYNDAEQTVAKESGARYINVTPWFCSTICTAVVGRYDVYYNQYHITADYSILLERVLQQALRLPADS